MDDHQYKILKKLVRERTIAVTLGGFFGLMLSLVVLTIIYIILLLYGIKNEMVGGWFIYVLPLLVIIIILAVFCLICYPTITTIEYEQPDVSSYDSSKNSMQEAFITFGIYLFFIGLTQLGKGFNLICTPFPMIYKLIIPLKGGASMEVKELAERTGIDPVEVIVCLKRLDAVTFIKGYMKLNSKWYNALNKTGKQ